MGTFVGGWGGMETTYVEFGGDGLSTWICQSAASSTLETPTLVALSAKQSKPMYYECSDRLFVMLNKAMLGIFYIYKQ